MRALTLVLVLCGVAGCGSGTSSGLSPAEAQAACADLIASYYCPKAVECTNAITQADCVSGGKTVIDCTIVTGENGHLDTCRSELAAETCPIFWDGTNVHMPASCMHVFLHP